MPTEFLHGVEVISLDGGPRPVRTLKSNVIGLVGTAVKGPINTPTLITSRREGVLMFGENFGTIPDALDDIYDQAGASVVVVNVFDPAIYKVTVAAADHAFVDGVLRIAAPAYPIREVVVTDSTGITTYVAGTHYTANLDTGVITRIAAAGAPAAGATVKVAYAYPTEATPLLQRSGEDYTLVGGTVTIVAPAFPISMVTITDSTAATTYVAGTDYTVDLDTGVITRIAAGAIGATDALKVTYSYPDPARNLLTAVVGGVDADTGAYQGVQAWLSAKSVAKVTPRILIAPGYMEQVSAQGNAGPVLAETYGIADRLRAAIITDGPNTNDAAAVTLRESISSRRVYIVDPHVLVYDPETGTEVQRPAAARVAGLIAKSDAERGFWWSPSNRPLYGIVGTARAVDFELGDPNSRANRLNANEVATIIREDGFRLWGNRTCSDDPKYAFINVVRTEDIISDSLLRAHLWAVDRCVGKAYLESVTGSVNAYLRSLRSQGAILGGECWVDPEENPPDQIAAGGDGPGVIFDFDFTPCYPAERIRFRSRLVNDYLERIF